MKFFNGGLYALILTIFFQTQLVAEYLYKDEIVNRVTFTQQLEELGKELYEKTGVKLLLVMLENLPEGVGIVEYQKELLKTFSEPTVILILSRDTSELDIQVNDTSLYEYFNREQVLSPVASAVQAFIVAIMYGDSWAHFNELRLNYGGSILPLIAGKSKPEQTVGKYAGSMFNGYIDIAQQIARSKGVVLENDPGDTNQQTLFYVKLFFYGFIIYGIVMYIRRALYKKRHKNE